MAGRTPRQAVAVATNVSVDATMKPAVSIRTGCSSSARPRKRGHLMRRAAAASRCGVTGSTARRAAATQQARHSRPKIAIVALGTVVGVTDMVKRGRRAGVGGGQSLQHGLDARLFGQQELPEAGAGEEQIIPAVLRQRLLPRVARGHAA